MADVVTSSNDDSEKQQLNQADAGGNFDAALYQVGNRQIGQAPPTGDAGLTQVSIGSGDGRTYNPLNFDGHLAQGNAIYGDLSKFDKGTLDPSHPVVTAALDHINSNDAAAGHIQSRLAAIQTALKQYG
jgi:hypothetical protein